MCFQGNGDCKRVVQRTLAVLLALAGLLLLVITVRWQPESAAGWTHAAHQLADQAWPLFLLAALTALIYQRMLRHRIRNEFVQLSGESIVRAMAPKQVITTLLAKTYGSANPTADVVAGLLGGEGIDPHCGDLTISIRTTVDYQLRRIDRRAYELKYTVTYSFKDDVTDPRFAIFATCDPILRDSIALACRLPLYEEWFVPNAELFDRSVDEIASSANLGIEYTDRDGGRYVVPPTKVRLSEVSYREWPDFLTFFREPMGPMPKQSPSQYLGTLRIFQFDLGELAAEDHAVDSIRSLSLTSTSIQPVHDPFLFWQAPYPCYVERFGFDARGLGWDGEPTWLFRVATFALRTAAASGQWVPAEKLGDLSVRSWLLPGHGVALMWKPESDDDTAFDGSYHP